MASPQLDKVTNEAMKIKSQSDRNWHEIINGARCDTYSWSQGHGDLEIHVRLPKGKLVVHSDIEVELQRRNIAVRVVHDRSTVFQPICGRFEHEVDTESLYWMVDKDSSCLVIYLDKTEELWWTKLLDNEVPTEVGPKNFTVPMDQMDEGARMTIDKLVTDQRRKLISARDRDELPSA